MTRARLYAIAALALACPAASQAAPTRADELVRVIRNIDGVTREVRFETRAGKTRVKLLRDRVVVKDAAASTAARIEFRQLVDEFARADSSHEKKGVTPAKLSCRAWFRVIFRADRREYRLRRCFKLADDRFNALFFDLSRIVDKFSRRAP